VIRRIVQFALFVAIYSVLFVAMRWVFNTVPLDLTIGQLSTLELVGLGVMGVVALLLTKWGSHVLSKQQVI